MPILRKLKSLLGVDDGEDDAERDVTVTVEHDPENEAAVKGAEVEESTPGGDGDDTTVADASESTVSAEEERDQTESAEPGSESGESDAAEAEEETEAAPDEVEIPDAEEPVEETTDEESDGSDDGAETDDETEAGVDDSAAGEPVDALNGIGPAYAERLGDAGVDSVAELAEADAAELSDATEIAEGRIQNWIDQAAEY